MYESGMSIEAISLETSHSSKWVRKRLIEAGATIRPPARRGPGQTPSRMTDGVKGKSDGPRKALTRNSMTGHRRRGLM